MRALVLLIAVAFLGACGSADPPAPSSNPAAAVRSIQDNEYLKVMRPMARPGISDTAIVETGHAVCDATAKGTSRAQVQQVLADQLIADSSNVGFAWGYTLAHYCPSK